MSLKKTNGMSEQEGRAEDPGAEKLGAENDWQAKDPTAEALRESLVRAAENFCAEELHEALARGANPNQVVDDNVPLLFFLLAKGGLSAGTDCKSYTRCPASKIEDSAFLNCVRLLLEHKANCRATREELKNREQSLASPLHVLLVHARANELRSLTSHDEVLAVMSLLIDHGCLLGEWSTTMPSPLQFFEKEWACEAFWPPQCSNSFAADILELLISGGANPHVVDNMCDHPAHNPRGHLPSGPDPDSPDGGDCGGDSGGSSVLVDATTKELELATFPYHLKAGDNVDLCDTTNSWLVAKILLIASDPSVAPSFGVSGSTPEPKVFPSIQDEMRMTYYAWGTWWDEWVTRGSPRIRPAHTVSLPCKMTNRVAGVGRSYYDRLVHRLTCQPSVSVIEMILRHIEKGKARYAQTKANLLAALDQTDLFPSVLQQVVLTFLFV